MADNRANLVVDVPKCLTGDSLTDDINVGNDAQLLQRINRVTNLISLCHLRHIGADPIHQLQVWQESLRVPFLENVLLELEAAFELFKGSQVGEDVLNRDLTHRKVNALFRLEAFESLRFHLGTLLSCHEELRVVTDVQLLQVSHLAKDVS